MLWNDEEMKEIEVINNNDESIECDYEDFLEQNNYDDVLVDKLSRLVRRECRQFEWCNDNGEVFIVKRISR